ncbi:hypothetical protein, partial [Glaciibacter flavus]|uniref:hypothetical protein n=1 Tax=Orlajensenia flava TaxID=2565934 RepID=UPI003B00E006
GQGSGALFPTWTEAIHYAQRQAASEDRAALYQAAQNGLMKARSRVAAVSEREAAGLGVSCRHEVHELCVTPWCECECHEIGETA